MQIRYVQHGDVVYIVTGNDDEEALEKLQRALSLTEEELSVFDILGFADPETNTGIIGVFAAEGIGCYEAPFGKPEEYRSYRVR